MEFSHDHVEYPEQLFVLVMGVSGTGKTTVAKALAQKFEGIYIEADDWHSELNIARMRAGVPLDDDDRWPWLETVATAGLNGAKASHGPIFIACSALKRAYRDKLKNMLGPLVIIHLAGPAELISARMAQRAEHFMPPALLSSQMASLEHPETNEDAITVSVEEPFEVMIAALVAILKSHQSQGKPL